MYYFEYLLEVFVKKLNSEKYKILSKIENGHIYEYIKILRFNNTFLLRITKRFESTKHPQAPIYLYLCFHPLLTGFFRCLYIRKIPTFLEVLYYIIPFYRNGNISIV